MEQQRTWGPEGERAGASLGLLQGRSRQRNKGCRYQHEMTMMCRANMRPELPLQRHPRVSNRHTHTLPPHLQLLPSQK